MCFGQSILNRKPLNNGPDGKMQNAKVRCKKTGVYNVKNLITHFYFANIMLG